MRQRDNYVMLFRATGNSDYLQMPRISRNRVNSMISRSKAEYIKSKLHENNTNPKKFWRVVNSIINPGKSNPIDMRFYD